MRSYSQLSEFHFLIDHDLDLQTSNGLCPVHNIQAYFGKISLNDVSKILNLGEVFKVKVIVDVAFHKLKYEPSLMSL